MGKTIITGQGVSGAALCLISAPVGVAVAGIAGVATATTFCVDKYLNAGRRGGSFESFSKLGTGSTDKIQIRYKFD